MSKVFNVTPKPAMLRSVQNEKWHVTGALAEILDNSFGPGRGNAGSVVISYDSKTRVMTILDDGRGMDAIGRLFQHGNSIGRSIGDIGEYGAGGTKAILWLASQVDIWTLRDGKVQFDSVLWRAWFPAESFDTLGVSDDWRRATASNTPSDLLACKHGTLIKLHLLATRKFQVGHVIRDLSKTYSTGLRRGKRITWNVMRNEEVLEERQLTDPFLQPSEHAEVVNFDLVLEYGEQHLPVSGRVFYDETTPQSESRIQIGYGFRVIRSANECFQSADGEERYAGIGVSGWLDLGEGWQPYLSTTKDAIDDAPLFDTLMAHVFERIKPLLKKAERKSFDLQFEDLALGLERALNTHDGDIVVQTDVQAGRRPPSDGEGGINPAPGPVPSDLPDPTIPSGTPGDIEKKIHPNLRLLIIPTSDVQMGGHLCRAEISGDDVMILTNEDHPIVREAMKSKPINRMALNLMTIAELAEAIAALDDAERFVLRLFRRNLAVTINDITDLRDRARTIGRHLIDRVRTPVVQMDAAE